MLYVITMLLSYIYVTLLLIFFYISISFLSLLSITSLYHLKCKIQNLLKFVKADINQVRGETDSAFLARSIANN